MDINKLAAKVSELRDEAHRLTGESKEYEKAGKKLEDAINLCAKWTKDQPDSAFAFYKWGTIIAILVDHYETYGYLIGKNKKDALLLVKEAITKYETAIKLDPAFGSAYMDLSSLYRKIGEDKKAEHYREMGVKLTVKGVRHISFK